MLLLSNVAFTQIVSTKGSVSLKRVSGDVFVMRDGEKQIGQPGMELQQNDLIETTGNGQVDVVKDGAWGYRLLADSKSVLNSTDEKQIRIEMQSGNIIVHVKKLPKNGKFQVSTPMAVAAVRGTQFWGRVQAAIVNTSVTFAVRQGIVDITIPVTGETTQLVEGQAFDIYALAPPTRIRPALNAEMQAMAQADEILRKGKAENPRDLDGEEDFSQEDELDSDDIQDPESESTKSAASENHDKG